jgi:hypothetical protein
MDGRAGLTDDSHGSRVQLYTQEPGAPMSTTQLIIVAVLSLAVVALLMLRQRQVN